MSNIKTEVSGAVGIATLNRPEALNALSTPLLDELADALEAWDRGTEVRCIIITGSERAFAAGADIKEMQPKTYSQMYRENLFGDQFDRIARVRKPIIAAVAGHALGGGCELALACHIRIASDKAQIGLPEVTLGIIPGYGGTQRMARLLGKGKALELICTGDRINAAEAEKIGLVNRVVPADQLMATCEEMAKKIASRGPLAIRASIEAVNNGVNMSFEEGQFLEATLFGLLCASDDTKEGMRAFLEKRAANFQGR